MADLALKFDLTRTDWPIVAASDARVERRLNVLAAFDGSVIGQVDVAGERHVQDALFTAFALYRNKDRWLPLHRRIAILRRTAELVAEHAELLALEAAREGGKPLRDSRVEVERVIDCAELAAEHIRHDVGDAVPLGGSARTAGRLGLTRLEPLGVAVAVSAFNHPLNLIAHQVFAAIAAGCPVIVKPAEDTPLSCLRLVHILHQAGLPHAWCQVLLTESHEVTGQLVNDARVSFFSFIGSAAVGWKLRAQLPPGTRCALEHGGVAPVLLASDADRSAALAAIVMGGFYHAGQVCVSVQRVYAPAAWAEEFAQELADAAAALNVGDPTLEATDVGPLIRPVEVTRVHSWVQEAVSGGAKLLGGGEPLSDRCYSPTVLFGPALDSKVASQEIFGPVVAVFGYDDFDDACDRANALPFAFQAAVFTASTDTALRAFRLIDASAVMVNDHTAFRDDGMPFAGLRRSGLGVGGIPHSIDEMQVRKMLVVRSAEL